MAYKLAKRRISDDSLLYYFDMVRTPRGGIFQAIKRAQILSDSCVDTAMTGATAYITVEDESGNILHRI